MNNTHILKNRSNINSAPAYQQETDEEEELDIKEIRVLENYRKSHSKRFSLVQVKMFIGITIIVSIVFTMFFGGVIRSTFPILFGKEIASHNRAIVLQMEDHFGDYATTLLEKALATKVQAVAEEAEEVKQEGDEGK